MRATRSWMLALALVLALASGTTLAQGTVTIHAWTGGPSDAFRTYQDSLHAVVDKVNQALDDEMYGAHVKLDATFTAGPQAAYLQRVSKAFQAGQAPQIVQLPASSIPAFAAAGYLAPLDQYISRNSQFNDVAPALWTAVSVGGHRYGAPLDVHTELLYFNKVLLAKLGWSQDRIAALPQKLASGQFTWNDLATTAREAVSKGVVARGHGFLPAPGEGDVLAQYLAFGGQAFDASTGTLILDESALQRYFTWLAEAETQGVMQSSVTAGDADAYHKAVTQGDGGVLFFTGDSDYWKTWASSYVADRGQQSWLAAHVGFGPEPAWQQGGTPVTVSDPQAYALWSGATAREQDLAVRVIARATAPDVEARNDAATGRLPVLTTTAEALTDPFLKAATGLLRFARFRPASTAYPTWLQLLREGAADVEAGKLKPKDAVDRVATRMTQQLAAKVTVHPR